MVPWRASSARFKEALGVVYRLRGRSVNALALHFCIAKNLEISVDLNPKGLYTEINGLELRGKRCDPAKVEDLSAPFC